MSNLLIVESKNDRIFIEKFIEKLNFDNIEIDKPICIDDYQCLEGLSEKDLIKSLESLSASLLKKDIKKVGIIIDQDDCSQEERLKLLNNCIDKEFIKSNSIDSIKQLINVQHKADKSLQIKIGCYFTNVDGKGELETLLKAIKTKDSFYADCLDSWQNCLTSNKKKISQKNFDKFWVSNYLRYDTCSPEEAKQAGKKCAMSAFDYVLREKSDIFNFESLLLNDLKDFLMLFKD